MPARFLEAKVQPQFLQSQDLEELLTLARQKYRVAFETVKIGDTELEVLQIADLNEYLDQLAESTQESISLPLWSKIWPASILLSYHLGTLPVNSSTSVLELGAGVGLCGMYAATRGFFVTLTDNHEDALLFAKINVLRNNLQEQVQVKELDFAQDQLSEQFSLILGSEILYHEDIYSPLVLFLKNHLYPDPAAEILLAASRDRSPEQFFQIAKNEFNIARKDFGYQDVSAQSSEDSDSFQGTIYRLKRKGHD